MQQLDNVWTIILAAGEGSRLKLDNQNKVALTLKGKPLIIHTIDKLHELGLNNIVTVVGFAKESVIKLLDPTIKIAEQEKREGTANAVSAGLTKVPDSASEVLVLQGDDSYNLEGIWLEELFKTHKAGNNKLTFLTTDLDNPSGIGRIIRDQNSNLADLVEEKDASDEQKKVKEINIGVYLFEASFLREYLPKIQKSEVSGEFYLTQIIKLALVDGLKIEVIKINHPHWRGINTDLDLKKAQEKI